LRLDGFKKTDDCAPQNEEKPLQRITTTDYFAPKLIERVESSAMNGCVDRANARERERERERERAIEGNSIKMELNDGPSWTVLGIYGCKKYRMWTMNRWLLYGNGLGTSNPGV